MSDAGCPHLHAVPRRAAVHLEKGDYGEAVKDCDAAVERGRELRADFKLIAKALARKGAALAKAGDLPAAVEAYQKSLTEHRCGLPPSMVETGACGGERAKRRSGRNSVCAH